MIRWKNKSPEEVLDYYWRVPLDDGDTVLSADVVLVEGDVTVSDVTHTEKTVQVWLSGGTSGVTAALDIVVVTADNRTFKETALITIASSRTAEDPEKSDEVLRANLAEARRQYHALATGTAAAAFVDQNGERVQFVKADLGRLYTYIQQLEQELNPVVDLTPSRSTHPRPLRPYFG